jgi:hypothetical protein
MTTDDKNVDETVEQLATTLVTKQRYVWEDFVKLASVLDDPIVVSTLQQMGLLGPNPMTAIGAAVLVAGKRIEFKDNQRRR